MTNDGTPSGHPHLFSLARARPRLVTSGASTRLRRLCQSSRTCFFTPCKHGCHTEQENAPCLSHKPLSASNCRRERIGPMTAPVTENIAIRCIPRGQPMLTCSGSAPGFVRPSFGLCSTFVRPSFDLRSAFVRALFGLSPSFTGPFFVLSSSPVERSLEQVWSRVRAIPAQARSAGATWRCPR